MSVRRPPIRPGATTKKLEKAGQIDGLIAREVARHNRKIQNLAAQESAAISVAASGRRDVTLVRIKGERKEENTRHKQKLADLSARRRKIWSS